MVMLCVIAIIDSAATARLIKAEQIAEHFGIPSQNVHGHITLATYIGNDEERFISSCKRILSNHGKFPVYYDKIEAWTSTSGASSFIVAVPRKEHTLVAIQKEISKEWSAYLNKWTQESVWNPHTSLLYIPGADLDIVAEAMQEEFEPFVTQISRIEFTHVYENEVESSIEIVDFFELQ